MSAVAKRPVGVAIIAILVIIQGVFAVLGGIGFIIERNDDDFLSTISATSNEASATGWGLLIYGVIALLVGFAVWRGANWGRAVVGILEVIVIIGAVIGMFSLGSTYFWHSLWSIFFALVILFLLFNPRATEYFERAGPSRTAER